MNGQILASDAYVRAALSLNPVIHKEIIGTIHFHVERFYIGDVSENFKKGVTGPHSTLERLDSGEDRSSADGALVYFYEKTDPESMNYSGECLATVIVTNSQAMKFAE